MSTAKHSIAMLAQGLQREFPPGRDAACAPIADDVGFDVEGFSQGADASGRTDGEVEDIHGEDDTTNVRLKTTIAASPSINMKTLADRLLHARTTKKWLQKDLAVASGVSMGMIGMLEKGKRGADGKTPGSLAALTQALGVNYEWLAHNNGPMVGLAQTVGPLTQVNEALAPVSTAPAAIKEVADPLTAMAAIYGMLPPEQRRDAVAAATKAMAAYLTFVNHENPASHQDVPEFSHTAARNKTA